MNSFTPQDFVNKIKKQVEESCSSEDAFIQIPDLIVGLEWKPIEDIRWNLEAAKLLFEYLLTLPDSALVEKP